MNKLMPKGPLLVSDARHIEWRRHTREAAPALLDEFYRWEGKGFKSPEFTSLTPAHYFPEAGE